MAGRKHTVKPEDQDSHPEGKGLDAVPCSDDLVRCPNCNTDKFSVTYAPGFRSCWTCGKEIPDDYPDPKIWRFRTNPYGWDRIEQNKSSLID